MFTHFSYYIDNLINMLNGFDFLMVGTLGAGKIVLKNCKILYFFILTEKAIMKKQCCTSHVYPDTICKYCFDKLFFISN